LGCILYAICFLVHPFQDCGSLGILNARINMPANSPISDDMKSLIMLMLDVSCNVYVYIWFKFLFIYMVVIYFS
jgi:hypothetical protein